MGKPGTRVAERRARRKAWREARMAALARLREIPWDGEVLEAKPTAEIMAALAALGVETDESKFGELAAAHGSVARR